MVFRDFRTERSCQWSHAASESHGLRKPTHDDFNPLNGWIQRFKDRHGISSKVVAGESGEVYDASIQAWLNINLEAMLSSYADCDIYSADKAELFHYLLSSCTLALKGEPYTDRNVSKDRVMVLFCANMDTSNKCRWFIIGRSARPRCFKTRGCLTVT
ncbi:tigger transposable element-derived protein 6-like [Ornithodoros turicata]|uniref:tigger transposable element-derived protein 6-like n=1 Tax=Ornithodoros turicata TaxID=34597 RepID=UPI003138E8C8